MNPIRLLLLDDHILFREGLSRLLASEPDFEIAGNCGTSHEALEVLSHTPVDLVLLDFDLGEDHGSQFIQAARRAGYQGKFLMLTAGMTATESSIALQLGASGVFLKHNSPGTLAKAIRLVAAGEMWLDQKVIRRFETHVHSPFLRAWVRTLPEPGHSIANMLRLKYPWYRDDRGGVRDEGADAARE